MKMPIRFTVLFCLLSVAVSVHAFVLQGSRWPSPGATFHANFVFNGGKSPGNTSWNQAFRQAADSWSNGTNFRFTILDQRSDPCAGVSAGVPEDGFRSGAGFAPTDCGVAFGATTLAITTTYFQGSTTTETDIVFNSNEPWDVYEGAWRSSVSDFRRVAAHELGHALGLDHEERVPALMMAIVQPGSAIEGPLVDDRNGVAELYGAPAPPPPGAPIAMYLEEPAEGEVKSGIGNLRGWVVSQSGIDRIELFIDGTYKGEVPVGGRRADIQNTFPGYPDSLNSGYSRAFNYSLLTPGSHTVVVRAVDGVGRVLQSSARFSVAPLDSPFIADPDAVDYRSASVSLSGERLLIRNVAIDGQRYNLTLAWRTSTQGYEIIAVQRLN